MFTLKKPLKLKKIVACVSLSLCVFTAANAADPTTNTGKFLQLWEDIHKAENGYFSADGGPYHSIETLIVEAPDHGHQSTSEAYSYWLWLEAIYGQTTGDWSYLNNAFAKMEEQIIPTHEMQPSEGNYDPSKPATYAAEFASPEEYPSPLVVGAPVGVDPISAELAQTYGTWDIYGMHWLLDMDNVYGYGNMGDGTSTPSYINTFQRGEQESTWETITHPSWEDFSWGGSHGFLKWFIDENGNEPSKQYRYTNAPDADTRVVQVMYWAYQAIQAQGKNPETEIPDLMAKASKMGDYQRLAMFDKYFKPMGTQDANAPGATGMESAHYLMSWYYAWGGPIAQDQNWSWRISSSHVHFAYQNPIAALALSSFDPLIPASPTADDMWSENYERSLDFTEWLQSAEGAIAGGATNSQGGSYQPHDPQYADATFHGMVYDPHPVYHDPGSNTWFGWQPWAMQRMAELYFINNDQQAKKIIDKWISWVLTKHDNPQDNVLNLTDTTFELAGTLDWSGKPNAWDESAANHPENTNLHVSVKRGSHGQDIGVAASLAKTLIYYAAATQKHDTLHAGAKNTAEDLLDVLWNYYDGVGIASTEKRGDYSRFNDPVFVNSDYSGEMANGDAIDSDSTFLSIRSFYLDDPMYKEVEAAINENRPAEFKYHRFWAQADAATAYALYDSLLQDCGENCAPVASNQSVSVVKNETISFELAGVDRDGSIASYQLASQPSHGVVSLSGNTVVYTPTADYLGDDSFTFTVTDDDGAVSDAATVTIDVDNAFIAIVAPSNNEEFKPGSSLSVTLNGPAQADGELVLNNLMGNITTAAFSAGDISASITLPDSEGTYQLQAKLDLSTGDVYSDAVSLTVIDNDFTCSVSENVWNSGFVSNITVTNTSGSDMNGWTVKLLLSQGSSLSGNGWNGQYSQSGNVVTVTNMPWNSSLPAGESLSLGFQGTHSGNHSAVTCK